MHGFLQGSAYYYLYGIKLLYFSYIVSYTDKALFRHLGSVWTQQNSLERKKNWKIKNFLMFEVGKNERKKKSKREKLKENEENIVEDIFLTKM